VAKRGADFWAQHLFKHKTYVEARSVAAPFVAFWRVYAFHAMLLTAMAAVVSHCRGLAEGCWGAAHAQLVCPAPVCVCNNKRRCPLLALLQAYVWHERDRAAGFPWLRLAAALLLTTVADAWFRAARAAAHLVLLSARIPVRRKVTDRTGSPQGGVCPASWGSLTHSHSLTHSLL
jgi:hypothetical protein